MLKENQIITTPCPVCLSTKFKKMFDTYDHEYQTTEQYFPLNECLDCGLMYLSPRPDVSALDVIYPQSYNNFNIASGEVSYVRRISNVLQTKRYARLMNDLFKNPQNCRVLDVGSGDGFCLDRIKDAFPDCKTFGVEPNEMAAAHAGKKHQIFHGMIEDYQTDLKFDLIISSHVVEHVADPLSFMKKLRSFLAPNGVVIIDTPNIDCLQYRIFKNHWGGIHSPRHWTLFSTKTLSDLGQRADFQLLKLQELPINLYLVWSIHSYLYQFLSMRKFADRFFHPVKCMSSKSIYYLGLIVLGEILDRLTLWAGLGVGQQRAIFRQKN